MEKAEVDVNRMVHHWIIADKDYLVKLKKLIEKEKTPIEVRR